MFWFWCFKNFEIYFFLFIFLNTGPYRVKISKRYSYSFGYTKTVGLLVLVIFGSYSFDYFSTELFYLLPVVVLKNVTYILAYRNFKLKKVEISVVSSVRKTRFFSETVRQISIKFGWKVTIHHISRPIVFFSKF